MPPQGKKKSSEMENLKPRIIRDGLIDEMLISMALLRNQLNADPKVQKKEQNYIIRLENTINLFKIRRDELIGLERAIDVLPNDAEKQKEELRVQAREIRDQIMSKYDDVMGS